MAPVLGAILFNAKLSNSQGAKCFLPAQSTKINYRSISSADPQAKPFLFVCMYIDKS